MSGCGQESVAPAHTGKLLPPIVAKLNVIGEPSSQERIYLKLHVNFDHAEAQVKAVLEESGVVQNREAGKTVLAEWTNVQEGETHTVPVTVKAEKSGQGSVKVRVEAYDQEGRFKYSMNPTKYFLVTEEEVLTGINGFEELELEHLDQLKERGKILDKEYARRKVEILKGN